MTKMPDSLFGTNMSELNFGIEKKNPSDRVIALAGNPNVGKSTVFNALTGMRQHTGNWPGKTVSGARGVYTHHGTDYILVDLPGTYSLLSHSQEEEVARDFLCYGKADAVIVVCDATCLERNLNLVLQILEITSQVVVCINLMDEAEKKKIRIDTAALSVRLGVPVVCSCAKNEIGLNDLTDAVEALLQGAKPKALSVSYPAPIEEAISYIVPYFSEKESPSPRWIARKLLEEETLPEDFDFLKTGWNQAKALLQASNLTGERFKDAVVTALITQAEEIGKETVRFENKKYQKRDHLLDRLLTSRLTGIPLMLLLFAIIFWLTISGANYPSALLSSLFSYLEELLMAACAWLKLPNWLCEMLCHGMFRTVGWIVSVMLPPMAIFFPLFTLLEDLGYLPRIAFNLDKAFQKCKACGKQALTMCMGFGCNAAGVVGCRIIDSPRERMIAILTNNFVPCNGRFPTLITMIAMFFAATSPYSSLWQTVLLTLTVTAGILMTFLVSYLLSKTLLKGKPSSFTLELPPYRKPNIGKVIIRSIFDRTLFVLGRAMAVAAPAGLLLWIFANVEVGTQTLMAHFSGFLDPLARWFGLDGVILLGFILGLPANEIVLPIIMMAYLSTGSLMEANNLLSLKELLIQNGWTYTTALCTMVFCLFHWPCSTTLITIKKETGSIKWTALSALIPTLTGLIICFLITTVSRIL